MTTAAVKITDAEIKRQAAGTVRDLRDFENRGLYLRFAKARARASWFLVVRGKWNRIGSYPDLSVKQVVSALPDIRLRLDAGANTNLSKWLTAGELLEWYAERMARDRSLSDKRKDTSASAIKCHLIPRLGAAPLAAIDKALLDRDLMWPLQETLSIDYVRLVFQLLALAFRQAHKLGLIASNPLAVIKFSDFSKAKVTVKPSRLRGVHIEDLLQLLLRAMFPIMNDAMLALMMLCHGTRVGETRMARWDHVSLAERVWFLPAADTKTRVEHYLPLTDQVRHLLMRYREVQQARGYTGPFLFPGRRGKPLSESQASAVFTRMGKGEWTSHDLRKLARTGWADIGIDHLIGELLINHAMGHNVKVYIQSDVMARKRDALEKWHQYLDGKGLSIILGLTGFRSGDSDKPLQATAQKACDPIQESTIGEVSNADSGRSAPRSGSSARRYQLDADGGYFQRPLCARAAHDFRQGDPHPGLQRFGSCRPQCGARPDHGGQQVKSHGPAFRKELKPLMECGICRGATVVRGIFHQLDCDHCNASGWVCASTGEPLPLPEMVQQLNLKLRSVTAELNRARHSQGGAHEQYEQNNRRGAGGSNYTGD